MPNLENSRSARTQYKRLQVAAYCRVSTQHSGELLITILSSQAQEESRNISENCHWGIVRQFENGVVRVNCKNSWATQETKTGILSSFRKKRNWCAGSYVFLEGNSSYKIKEVLEADGIRTVTGSPKWSASVIDRMLSNEKYMGDALLQKTYTVDFLTKKKVINRGIVPQYYIEDDHDAIIPKELFYRVQEEKARRASIYRPGSKKRADPIKGKYSSKFVLSDICICGRCGQPYRRQVWSKYGVKKPVWRCDSRLKYGTKKCSHSPTLAETTLHEAIMEAINSVVEDQGEFVEAFRENVIRIIGSYSADKEPTEYDGQIDSLQRQMMTLIEESAKLENADEEFDRQYREIADQIKELKRRKQSGYGKSIWRSPTNSGRRLWTAI